MFFYEEYDDYIENCVTFDWDEITYDEKAILKQQEMIKEIHALGGKVMLSSHTFRPLFRSGELWEF